MVENADRPFRLWVLIALCPVQMADETSLRLTESGGSWSVQSVITLSCTCRCGSASLARGQSGAKRQGGQVVRGRDGIERAFVTNPSGGGVSSTVPGVLAWSDQSVVPLASLMVLAWQWSEPWWVRTFPGGLEGGASGPPVFCCRFMHAPPRSREKNLSGMRRGIRERLSEIFRGVRWPCLCRRPLSRTVAIPSRWGFPAVSSFSREALESASGCSLLRRSNLTSLTIAVT
ncbi:hypothetical protein QF026_003891 [Streptomyces aurantiacus]|nr:hypothetical protein [Streptomyces aurantiacus]